MTTLSDYTWALIYHKVYVDYILLNKNSNAPNVVYTLTRSYPLLGVLYTRLPIISDAFTLLCHVVTVLYNLCLKPFQGFSLLH